MAYKSGKKCPVCKSCTDYVYLNNDRYFYCWLCDEYYTTDNRLLVKADVTKLGFNKASLRQQMYPTGKSV